MLPSLVFTAMQRPPSFLEGTLYPRLHSVPLPTNQLYGSSANGSRNGLRRKSRVTNDYEVDAMSSRRYPSRESSKVPE